MHLCFKNFCYLNDHFIKLERNDITFIYVLCIYSSAMVPTEHYKRQYFNIKNIVQLVPTYSNRLNFK